MIRYWIESVRLLRKSPPVFDELWTYMGISCLSGALTGFIRSFVMIPLMFEYSNEVHVFVAVPVVFGIMCFMLRGIKLQHPFIIAFGGICMGVGFWPTLRLDFLNFPVSVTLILFGILISLPIFIREIKLVQITMK